MNSKLASRYAKSLLQLAEEQKKLEAVNGDISLFNSIVESNRDFELLLKSPIVNADKKSAVIDKVFTKKVDDLTLAFFKIAIKKKRENILPEIGLAFKELYKESNGILSATLTTADKAEEGFEKKIKEALLSATGKKEVELNKEVDKDIIGGFVLEYEGNLYDTSIASKLREIEQQF